METGQKVRCPECKGLRSCSVRGEYLHQWGSGEKPFYMDVTDTHRLLQCQGCETVFYYKESRDSENVDVTWDPVTGAEIIFEVTTIDTYPKELENEITPNYIVQAAKKDNLLHGILWEMNSSANNNCYTLATVGLRTAIDRITYLLNIKENLRFEEKLDALKNGGYIGDTELQTLSIIINAGNAAAHRGWKPSKEQFETFLAAFQHFFPRALEKGQTIMAIKDQIPGRKH